MIQIPLDKLREIVDEDKALSDVILGAFIARRSILIDVGTGIKLIGSRFSPDSRRLREFLARNRMPHQWIDLEEDQEADSLLSGLAVKPDETPVVIASGGEILRNPSNAELGKAIGLGSRGGGAGVGGVRRGGERCVGGCRARVGSVGVGESLPAPRGQFEQRRYVDGNRFRERSPTSCLRGSLLGPSRSSHAGMPPPAHATTACPSRWSRGTSPRPSIR